MSGPFTQLGRPPRVRDMEVGTRLVSFFCGTNPCVCNTLGQEAAFMSIAKSLESLEQQRANIANQIAV